MTLTPDFSAFTTAFTNTWTLGTEWILPVVLAIMVMAIITKDIEKWKIMMFPMFVIERMLGIPVHFALMSLAGIVFAIETLSTQIVGNLISGVKQRITTRDERKIRKQEKVTKLFERANLQERKAFGQTKNTSLISPETLEEMRKRMGLQKWKYQKK